MTMAFKYQVSLCLRPSDVLLVTFNHMDAISSYVNDSPTIHQQVEFVYRLLIQVSHSVPQCATSTCLVSVMPCHSTGVLWLNKST